MRKLLLVAGVLALCSGCAGMGPTVYSYSDYSYNGPRASPPANPLAILDKAIPKCWPAQRHTGWHAAHGDRRTNYYTDYRGRQRVWTSARVHKRTVCSPAW